MFNLISKVSAQTVGAESFPTIPIFTEATGFRGIIANVINGALIIAGILAVVYLIYGGIMYITAGANSEQADKGKTAIINAIIGIVIIFLALILVRVVVGVLQSGAAGVS